MANAERPTSDSAQHDPLYEFRVTLKEIDRFYDFEYARGSNVTVRRVDVVDGKPRIVFGVWRQVGKRTVDLAEEEVKTKVGWRYHDEMGDEIHPKDVNVLHCNIQRSQSNRTEGRAFHRADSTPIGADNWLYVFRSKPGCKHAHLYEELYFEKSGVFQRMSDRERDRSRREWERAASDPARPDETPRVLPGTARQETELWLPMEIVSTGARSRACYYFYLAAIQLPWDALEQILRDLPGRAVGHDDDFYTDAFLSRRPDQVVPSCAMLESSLAPDAPRIAQILARGARVDPKRDGSICRILHLPNPLKEGLRRASDLAAALKRHEDALQAKANDPEYRLARAIELFTKKDDGLRKIVAKKLDDYLYPEGFDRIDRLWRAANSHARALVSWIGLAEQRSFASWVLLHLAQPDIVRTGRQLDPPEDPPQSPAWRWKSGYSAFSDAVRYYAQAATGDRERVATIIATVHARLPDLPAGQAYLRGNLDGFLKLTEKDLEAHLQGRGKTDSAYGGLDLVFAWNKKWGKGATTALTGIHWSYASAWAAKNDKLVELLDDINKEVFPQAPLDVYPRALNTFKACAKTASGVREMLSLAVDLRKLRDHRDDALGWFKASGSAAKAIGAARGATAAWTTAITQAEVNVPKISWYAIYGEAASLATGFVGLGDAHDSGERNGKAAEVAGMALALGACFASVGSSVLLNFTSWVLQYAGQWIKESYSDSGKYLYACEFGEPVRSVLKELIPLFPDSPRNNPWVKLKTENPAAWTFERQYREIEKLAYDFDCSLKLVMKPRYPHCLTADWVRSVDLTVRVPGKEARHVVSRLQPNQTVNAPASKGLLLHKDHSISIELAELAVPGFRSGGFRFEKPPTVTIDGTAQLTVPSSLTRDFTKSIRVETPAAMIALTRVPSSWATDAVAVPQVAFRGVVP